MYPPPFDEEGDSLGLRLRHRIASAATTLVHELIELGTILRGAQAIQEFTELALLFFKPLERFGLVLVEGAVAARLRAAPPARTAVHVAFHALHLLLHALHLMLPARRTVAMASHASAPYEEGECGEAERPPDEEAQDRQ